MRPLASFFVAALLLAGCSNASSNSAGAASGTEASAPATAASDPSAVVKTFYDWYLAQPSSLPGVHDWRLHFADTETVFDPDLFAMIQQGVKLDAAGNGPVFDFDPFTNSQVGFIGYALGSPVAKAQDVDVPVAIESCLSCDKSTPWPAAFTPSPWPSGGGGIVAVVRKNASGGYVIYDLVYQGSGLRSYLQNSLKKPSPAAT